MPQALLFSLVFLAASLLAAWTSYRRGYARALREHHVIRGWKCLLCGVFNGEEKGPRSDCRGCGHNHHR